MIVRRLRLHPFGCFADRETSFEPGLNVVLGANEAGKSTLFHAARTALLRTTLDKRKFSEYLSRFLPASGGDTVRVEMDFQVPEGLYRLKRCWGPARASELLLPGGEVLSDDEAVRTRLESVLPARLGSFWSVLFTSQTELAAAVATLQKEAQEALSDLSDILRRSTLATGGVSPDRFRALLESRIAIAFDNWDTAHSVPRGNRGLNNPWKKNVGEILAAYYEKEELAHSLRLAREIESRVDETNRSLREVSDALERTRRFLEKHRPAYEDARSRGTLDAELQAVRAEQRELARLATDWPVTSSEEQKLATAVSALETRIEPLRREKLDAAREQDNAALRERLERLERLARRLTEAQAAAKNAPRIGRTEMEELRAAMAAVEGAAAGVAGRKLRVTVTARAFCEIRVARDAHPVQTLSLAAGEEKNMEAAGRIRIEHPELGIDVRSGDPGAGRGTLEEARARLADMLASHGVAGIAQAEEMLRSSGVLEAEVQAAQRNLDEELGGESIETLRERGRAIGSPRALRPLAVVAEELATVEGELLAARRELEEKRERIRGWENTYGSALRLIEALAAKKSREAEIEKGLAAAAPLPAGYAEAASFVRAYEKAREEHEHLKDRQHGIREEKVKLEAQMPDESAEELQARSTQASERFRESLERGNALQRVKAETTRLLESSDEAIYAGMKQELGRLMAVMTAERYAAVEMEGALPTGLASRAGPTLGWERLSAGTRDLLALALRLAMASRLLGEAKGLVMLDDPLVEMDPERQEAAAAALRAFAAERQLIVFTCHPAHARMLGGNRIQL